VPRSPSVPSYRHHKPTGQAVVTIRLPDGTRRDEYLGKFNSADSCREYARVIAEQALGLVPGSLAKPGSNVTVDQMLLPYWRYVEQHYRDPEGTPTTEVAEIKSSLIHLRALYG